MILSIILNKNYIYRHHNYMRLTSLLQFLSWLIRKQFLSERALNNRYYLCSVRIITFLGS